VNRSTLLAVATLAFLSPMAFVLYQHRETIQEMNRIDPRQGEMLFFTSPS
jgi:hypothetical protein